MADFPTAEVTSKSNQQVETQEVEFDAPAVDPSDSAEERWVEQQWIDAKAANLGATHPLSLNRDSDNITSDPYTTP